MPFTQEQLDAALSLVPNTPTLGGIIAELESHIDSRASNFAQTISANINAAVDARMTTVIQSQQFRAAVQQAITDNMETVVSDALAAFLQSQEFADAVAALIPAPPAPE